MGTKRATGPGSAGLASQLTEPGPNETLLHRLWLHATENPDGVGFIVPHSEGRKSTWRHPIVGRERFSYERVTWEQTARIVAALTYVLERDYGVKPNDRVGIVSWNRAEWMWLALATWSAGGIVIGVDPRLTAESTSYILNQADNAPAELSGSRLKVVFCEDHEQSGKVQLDQFGRSGVRVVQLSEAVAKALNNLHNTSGGSYEHLVHDRVAMLVATSGSSGNPKIVMITHGNLAHMSAAVPKRFALSSDDIYFGLLPANHIFAWNGQGPALWCGVTMFLCHPLDLKKHIRSVGPTVLLGVTKLWSMLMDELQAPLPNKLLARVKAAVVRRALAPDGSALDGVCNFIVAKALNRGLGGRLRMRITGGSAFPRELSRKLEVLRQKVILGYGLSETTGASTVGYVHKEVPGSSGDPLEGVTIAFKPLEDDDGTEIVIGGPTVSPGYWNDPALTAQSFINGAFHTGDVGHLEEGCLVVEGRVGEDGKTFNAEKVSSKEIVEEFEGSRLIQFIVPAFIGRPFVTALVYINEANARALVCEKGEDAAKLSLKDLTESAIIRSEVQAEIDRANERIGLKGQWKRIRKFAIVPITPSIENRLLSGKTEISAKLSKRMEAARIAAMYD